MSMTEETLSFDPPPRFADSPAADAAAEADAFGLAAPTAMADPPPRARGGADVVARFRLAAAAAAITERAPPVVAVAPAAPRDGPWDAFARGAARPAPASDDDLAERAPPVLAVAPVAPLNGPWGNVARVTALLSDDFALFVDRNEQKFRPIHLAQTTTGAPWRRSICWPGLLVPQVWLLYRKMYAMAALVILTPLVLAMLQCPPTIARAIAVLIWLACGAGRHLYVWSARRTIAHIRSSAADEETARDAFRRAGGVSRAGAAIGVLTMIEYVSSAHGVSVSL